MPTSPRRRGEVKKARRLFAFIFTAALAYVFFASASALAQTYPDRPVRLITTFAAGGSQVFLANVIGQKLAEKWGQQFVIDPRPGGSGNVAAEAVARAAPDGYTLLLGVQSLTLNAAMMAPGAAVDPFAFKPVVLFGAGQNVLVVPPESSAKDLRGFIAYAKSRPSGELNFVSLGAGSTSLLGTQLFQQLTGIQATAIPYNGGGQQATGDFLAGRISFWITSVGTALSNIQSGKMRALAVSGDTRTAALSDIPTFAEAGLPEFKAASWFSFLAPAGTPDDVVQTLNADVNAVLALPEVQERFAAISVETVGGPPQALTALMRDEVARWAKVKDQNGAK